MGDTHGYSSDPALQGLEGMAYRKVRAAHKGSLEREELQASALDLEWDMEKELQDPGLGLDRFQLECVEHRTVGNSNRADPDPDLEPIQPSVSVSPHGRFERLQEDPNYISHFTRASPKGQRRSSCSLVKYLLAGVGLFILGLLIGHYAHIRDKPTPEPPTDTDLLEELLKDITAEKIQALHRPFISISDDNEEARAEHLYQQWTDLGLTDVQLSNYSVLLSLPGPSSSRIVDRASHECFLPSGAQCDPRNHNNNPTADQHFSYAAYSATGSLEAVVVDVQYGGLEDMRRARTTMNVTNQIALLKLGQAPLLYKISFLAEMGFGGVLLYMDPCDSPSDQSLWHKAFGVTLNPGGDPSTPGYPSIERRKIQLTIGTHSIYKTVNNVCGYLRGKTNPDRYVLVGSRHDSWHKGTAADWRGGSAMMTQIITSVTKQARRGWEPDRTTVFCSWGGSALGNIGSFEWGEENRMVLQSRAVAYVSLHSPVRGTETLRSTASPSLLQLTSDIQKRQLLSCIRGGNCPGPNVSSLQIPGDVSFFANHLAVPTMEFAFEQTKAEEKSSFLSEALFSAESTETLDPLFKFHETIAKMTAEVILRLVNDPVLPFYPLDIALDVQNKLKDDPLRTPRLLAAAAYLRESSAFLQSETMRPANDPKERDPSHVRMLNDVLRDLEKSFMVPQPPPGVYRNLLYSLNGKFPQFSILKYPLDPLKHNAVNKSLSLIINAINSAEKLIRCGLDLFENSPDDTN
ncbi:inactive N-acetylated-alpha-linked acidic dipeptidase-like protein 2 isoform X2 [Salvelinus sp. IW2-2015]|uniref:inactive N-acetylated-alpha-linked acidic dipeptidase-like protein 2 isoform X2 n=1 Tax=Salvelinus sp. IW2-2015 TaxID=2691554 RepID=UPI0038D37418